MLMTVMIYFKEFHPLLMCFKAAMMSSIFQELWVVLLPAFFKKS